MHAMSVADISDKLRNNSGPMTSSTDVPDPAFSVQSRLRGLGVHTPRDIDRLINRLRRQSRPGERLEETLERRLCEWLNYQPLSNSLLSHQSRRTMVAVAEAAVALSGVAERWPLTLFHDATLPPEALRRLDLAVPVAAPPVVPVPMPVQSLEPAAVRAKLPTSTRGRPSLARARVR